MACKRERFERLRKQAPEADRSFRSCEKVKGDREFSTIINFYLRPTVDLDKNND